MRSMFDYNGTFERSERFNSTHSKYVETKPFSSKAEALKMAKARGRRLKMKYKKIAQKGDWNPKLMKVRRIKAKRVEASPMFSPSGSATDRGSSRPKLQRRQTH